MGKWRLMQAGILMTALLLSGCARQLPSKVQEAKTAEITESRPPADSANLASRVAEADGEEDGAVPEVVRRDWRTVPVIAHAMGTVDGRTETNSLDAFLQSYSAGQRVFEVDLQLTSDGHLVARHDWDQITYYNSEQEFMGVMDWETFLRTPVCFFYTPVDIEGLVSLMQEYPDVYFVTDSKDTDEASVRAQMKEIVRAVQEAGDPALWEQIIVQIYHEDMYTWITEEAPVANWIFTLYQIAEPDYHEIGAFCQEHDIPIVTMASERMKKDNCEILHSYDRLVYVHTVNHLHGMLAMSWAADGFYSDYVTLSQLESVLAGTDRMYLSVPQDQPKDAE